MTEDTRFKGTVVKQVIGRGSKSEREGIQIVTDEGQYVLRRVGGNPFHDNVLEALEGKTIEGDGQVRGYTLMMSQWAETESEPEPVEQPEEVEEEAETEEPEEEPPPH